MSYAKLPSNRSPEFLVQKQALQGIWAGDQVLPIGLGSQGRYDWG